MKIHSLSMRNFLSFGNNYTTIDFSKPCATLITGRDLDNTSDGLGANGVGKTVFINALTYALYDKPVSDISKDKLVNNVNNKNMEVRVTFEDQNKNVYTVVRVRKSKAGAAGNYVQLYKDDKEITLDSVGNTNDYIIQLLGIPYELFVRIVVFSATNTSFFELPARHASKANQTDIIEELFDLKTLSQKAAELKEHISDTEQRIETKQKQIEALEAEHQRYQQQIDSTRNRMEKWEQDTKNSIEERENKLNQLEQVDVDKQRELYEQLKQADQTLSDTKRQLSDVEKQIKEVTKQKKKEEDDLSHLEEQKCPYCLQKYANAEEKIKECKENITQADQQLEQLSNQLYELDQQIESEQNRRDQLAEQITVNNVDELIEIKNQSSAIQERITELKQEQNPFVEQLEELEQIELDPIDYDEINDLKTDVEHQKFLLKLLTNKDSFVRKTLLNKNIPFLNSRLEYYLNELGLPHKVEFTHEMTAFISYFDKELDYGNLSNGQRARVNFALSLAFRDVLQKMHGKINVCMFDEVLDHGLDSVGVQAAAKLLKRKAREEELSMFIISHREEIENAFDTTMEVQMSKGFSYIVSEEEAIKQQN